MVGQRISDREVRISYRCIDRYREMTPSPIPPAKFVSGLVYRYPKQPGLQRRVTAKAFYRPERSQECILREIACLLRILGQSVKQAKDIGGIPLDQCVERGRFASPQIFNKLRFLREQ